MDLRKLIAVEAKAINSVLYAQRIDAGTNPKWVQVVQSGFIRYNIRLAPGERQARVESVLRELSNGLSTARSRLLNEAHSVRARFSEMPQAIEVPHPAPKPLAWTYSVLRHAQPHTMLIGRSYIQQPRDEYVSFDDSPHTLIAGITNAGKSVLLQMMLLSLTHATSPADLRLVIVDLKNEDMLPFRNLPHVLRFAGNRDDALDAIRMVQAEKDARIADPGRKPHRLVLWIDEVAQLAQDNEARAMLGDLASIGRGKLINLVAATQYPTKEGGIGALMKANFPLRLVGMVAPGQSHIATGRPGTGAELLPGKGAFLRCQGADVYRFQAFYVNADEVIGLSNMVTDEHGGGYQVVTEPVITGYGAGYDAFASVSDGTDAITGYDNQFPIRAGRALTEGEAQAARRMAEAGEFDTAGRLSLNRAVMTIYGSKSSDRLAWVKEALETIGA